MAESNKLLYVTDRDEWRVWLSDNYADVKEIWLVFFKNHTGKPSIPYEDSVEEALCFGWIDSLVRRIDDERYARKFTPRNDGAVWSESNKTRVESMIRQGLMTEAGMAKVRAAKERGEWEAKPAVIPQWEMPAELREALNANRAAGDNFEKMAPTYQKHYIRWIASAKRPETRAKRVREAITLLERNEKLGLR